MFEEGMGKADKSKGGQIGTSETADIPREEQSAHRTKSQQRGAERKSASGHTDQDDKEREVAREGESKRNSQDEGNSDSGEERKTEPMISLRKLPIHDIDSIRTSQTHTSNSPRFWRWGPNATSEDAAKFFRRVI